VTSSGPRFGLDIGRVSVKLVRLDVGRGGSIGSVRGAFRDIDPGLDGGARKDAVVNAISECAAELEVKAGSVVAVSVPRAEAVVRRAMVPDVPDEERAALIRFQAAKDVPFEIDEAVLAHGAVGPAPAGGHDVLYAAVRSSVLEDLRGVVAAAGLVPGVLEVSTQAAARTARVTAPDIADGLLLVIGARASDIVVLEQGRVAVSRSASVGYARDNDGRNGWLERLAQEVQRSLRSAREGAALEPRALLLAGGGAARPGVAETLGGHLGLPPRVLSGLDDGDRARGAAYVVARGLVEPRVVDGVPCLDLAGVAERHRAARLKQLIGVSAAVGVLLAAGTAVFLSAELGARRHKVGELTAALDRVRPDEKKIRNLAHELQVAEKWQAKKTRALDVLLATATSLPQGEAYLTRFQWIEGRPITLNGRARDQRVGTKVVEGLQKNELVEKVLPRFSGSERAADEAKGIEFTMTVLLRGELGEKPR
jgi:Tfp pilus assembly PilM family ATPase